MTIHTVGGVDYNVKEVCGMTGNLDSAAKSHKKVFDVWRVDGDEPSVTAMWAAVQAVAPSTFDGLAPNNMSYAEDADTGHYLFDLAYNSYVPEALLRWGFDTTGGTVKLFTSKATTKYAPAGRTAPDFGGAIRVKVTGKDAEPEGVDVVTPGLKLTAKYKWAADTFDFAAMKILATLTGYTNDDFFYTFAAGELLFLGATGEIVTGVPTEVEYHFLASSNVTGLTIGAISGIAKKGHDYLWVAFEAAEDSSAKKLVQKPLGIYIERVYGEADYTAMGIGS